MPTDRPSAGLRIAVVAARFGEAVVDRLVETTVAELRRLGLEERDVEVHRVPGAFELPVAALAVLRGSRPPDAVICLGAVIRGETPHFDYVAMGAAQGIGRVSLDTGRPVIFGVLTTDTLEQAWERVDGRFRRGEDFARDAVTMASLLRSLTPTDG